MKQNEMVTRGASYAESMIKRAEADDIPQEIAVYAAAVMLAGIAPTKVLAMSVLEEVYAAARK